MWVRVGKTGGECAEIKVAHRVVGDSPLPHKLKSFHVVVIPFCYLEMNCGVGGDRGDLIRQHGVDQFH